MVTATCVAPGPVSVTVAGLKVQATVAGEQEKVTGPLNPFAAVSDSIRLPAAPPVTLRAVEDACKLKLRTPVAGGATATEPKRPPFSPLIPAAKYRVLGSPNVVVCPLFCPKNISHRPGFAIGVPAPVFSEPTSANVVGSKALITPSPKLPIRRSPPKLPKPVGASAIPQGAFNTPWPATRVMKFPLLSNSST